jgi:hypothetical protein
MPWLSDIVVPIVLGLLSAFGATAYSNWHNDKRRQLEDDARAEDAVRDYIRALRDTSASLEAQAMHLEGQVISAGGRDVVLRAYGAAAPYFHRLQVKDSDKNPLRNEFPDPGFDPMDGSGSYHERANQVQVVLGRGLKKRK